MAPRTVHFYSEGSRLEGDLFLDGRQVAEAFDVALPDPAYELKRHRATRARRVKSTPRTRNGQA